MGKNSEKTSAIREAALKKALAIAGNPFPLPPGYDDDSLTMAGQSIGESLANRPGKETMGGSTGRTEDPFQAQRAGEREDMSRFGDDKEKMGAAMGRSLMGSKKFTKGEIRRGYRKI